MRLPPDPRRPLKLDLHTHCREATSFAPPTLEIVLRIIETVEARGLDGLAITEHYDKEYGFRVRDLAEQHFPGRIVVIPGCEVDYGAGEMVQLFLPDGRVFQFLAHPGYPGQVASDADGLHGVELRNALHGGSIRPDWVRRFAEEHDLLLLSNSDAHSLDSIGAYYNEISLGQLSARAGGPGQP